jgi:hypothetical protein
MKYYFVMLWRCLIYGNDNEVLTGRICQLNCLLRTEPGIREFSEVNVYQIVPQGMVHAMVHTR